MNKVTSRHIIESHTIQYADASTDGETVTIPKEKLGALIAYNEAYIIGINIAVTVTYIGAFGFFYRARLYQPVTINADSYTAMVATGTEIKLPLNSDSLSIGFNIPYIPSAPDYDDSEITPVPRDIIFEVGLQINTAG